MPGIGQVVRRRGALLTVVMLAVSAAVGGPGRASATPAPAPPKRPALSTPVTVTFQYTGAAQTWTVPAGVTAATFTVLGAQGAKGAFDGANGGLAVAPLALTPGDVIQINVGGMGQTYQSDNCALLVKDAGYGAGGFNGGGNGGNDGCISSGGGGASDVRIGGTDLAHRVLVAGGGGGGSGDLFCPNAGGGGGLAGSSPDNLLCANAGGGGQTAGTGSGQLGQGGDGADQSGLANPGSGGGGGYYGGAGGQPGLAGAGGSGFGPPGTAFANGYQPGNGLVSVTYGDAPAVTGLVPSSGSALTAVTVVGSNFVPGATVVTFGGVPAQVSSCTTTSCQVVAPAGAGTVSVRVAANGEESLDTPADDFTYLPPPSITSFNPTSAPAGATITIQGNGFVATPGFTKAQFGSQQVPATCSSSTQCTAVVPALAVGLTPLSVVTLGGSSAGVSFSLLPAVTAISPDRGPPAGGTVVTITGSGFNTDPGGTAVSFGVTPATAVGCASVTTCTAVSPPGSGSVDIVVSVGGFQSSLVPGDRFTYTTSIGEKPPVIPVPPSSTTTTGPSRSSGSPGGSGSSAAGGSSGGSTGGSSAVVAATPRFTG